MSPARIRVLDARRGQHSYTGRRLSRVSLSLSLSLISPLSLARSLALSRLLPLARSLSRIAHTRTHARKHTCTDSVGGDAVLRPLPPTHESSARASVATLARLGGRPGSGPGSTSTWRPWPRNTSKYRRSMVRGRVGRREANRKGNWEVVGQGSSLPRLDAASADAGSRGGAEARLEPPEDCQGQLQPACEQHPG